MLSAIHPPVETGEAKDWSTALTGFVFMSCTVSVPKAKKVAPGEVARPNLTLMSFISSVDKVTDWIVDGMHVAMLQSITVVRVKERDDVRRIFLFCKMIFVASNVVPSTTSSNVKDRTPVFMFNSKESRVGSTKSSVNDVAERELDSMLIGVVGVMS